MRMARKLIFLSGCIFLWSAISSSAVFAQTPSDRIVAALHAQGFTVVEKRRTWLGRIAIEAEAPGVEREVVINRSTGEILRDYWEIDPAKRSTAGFPSIMPILGGLSTPGVAVPEVAVPGTVVPGTAVPGTVVPGTAVPGTAGTVSAVTPESAISAEVEDVEDIEDAEDQEDDEDEEDHDDEDENEDD